jgi:aconitate hydratase
MDNEYREAFLSTLATGEGEVHYLSLEKLESQAFPGLSRAPVSIRILAEAVARGVDGAQVMPEQLERFGTYDPREPGELEIPFAPARVLLQDFTGVPCVIDLAAMRSVMARLGGNPAQINPVLPVDLIIDHSIQVDAFGTSDALRQNTDMEFLRNRERYEFLRWGQEVFSDFSVVPPASGICHQVNLEYLGKVVQVRSDRGGPIACFDTVVGTDSHTPMINGLGVLGWGVGGIEAEAAMLGQPIYMLAPGVVGVKLTGELQPGVTATDLVLAVTELLRSHGVVGRFVEFYGSGLAKMTVPDRATLSNMAPEYGATVGYFPIDQQTLTYMRATGRPESQIDLVERYAKTQGVFRTEETREPVFQEVVTLDLAQVTPGVAGPKRPQDRIALSEVKPRFSELLEAPVSECGYQLTADQRTSGAEAVFGDGSRGILTHGNVVLAAITSCTNTSNPSVLIGAALLARNAIQAGLATKPWVKTSFAPGSVVVTEYLKEAGLLQYLERLGFNLVGYGCTTCIGNSGPLPEPIRAAVETGNLVVAGVLSGNRNFEGRINPHTKANFLASPPLVVAYALAGTVDIDLTTEPLGEGEDGSPIYLSELWPDQEELAEYVSRALDRTTFIRSYRDIESKNPQWNAIETSATELYQWDEASTYIKEPPFFSSMVAEPEPIEPITGARVLVMAGDSTTTDHISPAGAIDPNSPAGQYLSSRGVAVPEFNSYGSRRGNDQVMTRGTFANIRFRNLLVPGGEGSRTIYFPTGEETDIFSASCKYREAGIPTIVIGGKDYGMGSSRDWAAKGVYLLGVRAVLAESFERIHRSNLVGMGILPLQFMSSDTAQSLGLTGAEILDIQVTDGLVPRQEIEVTARYGQGGAKTFSVLCRIDSPVEAEYYRNGGILQTVLRGFLSGERA